MVGLIDYSSLFSNIEKSVEDKDFDVRSFYDEIDTTVFVDVIDLRDEERNTWYTPSFATYCTGSDGFHLCIVEGDLPVLFENKEKAVEEIHSIALDRYGLMVPYEPYEYTDKEDIGVHFPCFVTVIHPHHVKLDDEVHSEAHLHFTCGPFKTRTDVINGLQTVIEKLAEIAKEYG